MNKRIQELAEQADLFVNLNGNPWPRALSAEESVTAYNKFAELIVKECALCSSEIKDLNRMFELFGIDCH